MRCHNQRGFSLIEVLVSVSLLSVGVAAVAQLASLSARASAAAQQADVTRTAAREKLDQLRALTFGTEDGVLPVTDVGADLSVTPAVARGGAGLGVSPGEALLSNVEGYCDFLDATGQWMAGGSRPPRGAVWVRRWSIQAMNGLADTLLLQVVVVPAQVVGMEATEAAARAANAAWLVDIRTRSVR
ncbi:MAG: prepilin-type N-terminal cleavage/methylation domain-containing protein [Acidobacteria bacterium]|nr:prepilin-type N-terminal cleavage/methylation domain-containing protein [Acidobacteriota bacterium]